jgi:alpha-N-arabinofuranosidase
MAGPALFLRHISASAWDNAFINFDHCGWFAAPNYIVMKLWREHFAPYRIAIGDETGGLNTIATKSQNGKEIYFKTVNTNNKEVNVNLLILEDIKIEKAFMEIVAPDSLSARNTLEEPNNIQPVEREVAITGHKVTFNLPPISAAVVTIEVK